MEQQHRGLGASDVFMLLVALVWGINFSFIKYALLEFSPLGFNGFRMVFASLVLLTILYCSKEGFAVLRSDIWKIIVLGIVGNTFFQLFFILGIDRTRASNTAIIMAMTPVLIALLSSYLRHERIHRAGWAGILISFVGFFLVINQGVGKFDLSLQSLKGDLLIFLGNLMWAVYTVYSRPLLEKISPLKLTTLTMAAGTVFFLPFCIRDLRVLPYGDISWRAWASLFFSGFFALVICYVIWYISVKRVGNSRTAIYGNVTPVFAMIFAALFIAERISAYQVIGTVIILIGVTLTRVGYTWFIRRQSVGPPR